jgi:N utilization substance protein A
VIISAVEESLLAAARKSIKGLLNITVHVNPKTGDIVVTAQKEVVDKVTIPEEEITLEDARVLNPHVELGQWVDIPLHPARFRPYCCTNSAPGHLPKTPLC